MAGLPREVVDRAKLILNTLEKKSMKAEEITDQNVPQRVKHPRQLFLFADKPHPVVEELKAIDIDTLNPLEALAKLKELKDKL